MAPAGLAKFDSASAMAQALAHFLHGRDFPALGQSNLMRMAVQFSDLVPLPLRKRIFAQLGAQEGVKVEEIGRINTDEIAGWAASLYPRRRYPAVMIGSSNGALVHLGAAFGIPWLPQTFLALVRQKEVDLDNPVQAMEAGSQPAQRFLAANPGVQLHHLHDPSQDRLMLDLITYFRFKYLRLPTAYKDFLENALEPGGTIVIVDCGQSWPVTQVAERHLFQFGAVGGPTQEEYFHGGDRVRRFLRRQGSPRSVWAPPEPNRQRPEAEWGFEPQLGEDVVAFARQRGYRIEFLRFSDPEGLSPPVADLYRSWHAERGIPANRLVVESFILLEPYWVLRTGSVPFWMIFNMEPSLQTIQQYLAHSEPFDDLHLMLFAHGENSIGLPPVENWQDLFRLARKGGGFLGFNPRTYPAHFSVFARYSSAVRKLAGHYPLPPPLPMEKLETFVSALEPT